MSTLPAPDPGPTLRRVDLLPGQVLMQRYEVLRVLGRGAMGEVLEVRDRPSGLSYALKRVPAELVRDKAQMRSIQANFALVSQLAHPHIAITRHLELDPETGHAYLIMEMVHGTDMDLWLADRRAALGGPNAPLPMPEILGVAEQIASALDYAHAQPVSRGPDGRPARYGLLHRDLKPANVMVETARAFRPGIPYVKLVDFGLAAEIQASLHEHSIQARRENAAGTLLYMAPEQWEGRTLTRGVDQWAFAVVLYDMAAGRKPFAAQSSEALFLQVKRADPERPATLTPAQWEVFKKAFNPDRRGRFRSCMAFVKALAAADTRTEGSVVSAEMPMPDEFQGVPASGDPPVPATLEDRPPSAPRPAPRPRGPAAALALLAVLAAVLGMIGLGVNAWVNRKTSNDPAPKPGPAPRPEPVPGPAPTPEPAPKKPDAPEWKPLRLVWDERPAFEVWVSGTAFRNEGPARSGTAPVGGWIEIAAHPGTSQVYHELKWEGQPEIRLRQLGTVLEWSVPGGAWKPLSVDERATAEVGALGLEKRPDLTAPSLLIRDPGVPGMLDLMKALRPAAVTCLRDEHLDLLERIPSLRRVNLTEPAHVSLNALWRLEHLTAVDLGTSETLLTIQGVQDCKQLESLLLSGCTQVADLSPIGSLKHLRELMLPPQVTSKILNDWREGGVLDGLVYLSVGGSEGIGDLSFLRGLKHLSGLDLSNCRNVLELDALEALPPLRYLGLPPNATADDLERLRQAGVFDKLAMLALSAQHLESMSPLDGLTELTALTAMDANKLVDLSALRKMPNLRELRLYGSMSQELCDSLAALRRLRTLVLPSQCSDTQFKQLQASGCLDHLVSLDLNRSTFLADEGPLTQLKNLRLLNLTGCDGLLAPERLQNLRASLPACTILGVPEPVAEVPPAQEEVVLNAPTSFTLQNIPVPVGQRLKKGDRIGQLTGPALNAELDVAKARLAAAKAKAELARNELARAEGLFKQAVLSQAEWEKATLKAKEAEAEAVLAQKQAGLLNEVIQQGGMVMPFDGMIVKYHVQVGELAKAGEPFLTVRKDR